MKMFIKSNYLIVFGLFFCSLFSACHKNLSREQSEKHLKAFDSEIIMMVKQLAETNAYTVFEALPSLSKLPLPFNYPEKDALGDPLAFDFEQKKGIYQYNEKLDELMRLGVSDSIVILFPIYTEKDTVARLIVSNYKEEMSIWGLMFPTIAQIKLEVGSRTLFNLQLNSEMAYQFPVKCNIISTIDKFKLEAHLTTKLSKTKGRIKVNAQIFKREEQYLDINAGIVTKITNQNSMLFDQVKIYGNAFPITFKAKVNYGNINSGSHQFIDDFNEHSTISIYTEENEHVGDIELNEREDDDHLNFIVVYNDKSFSYLEDFMLTYKEIMNIKMF